MKLYRTLLPLLAILLPVSLFAQLSNGGLYSGFGVDADTRSNYLKYGLVTGAVLSDDWFSPSINGHNVIDTANAPFLLASLQSGANVSFSKRMSVPLYSKINSKLWLDAAYGRDFTAASSLKDSTTFTISSKNGDDPVNWVGGISSFPNKNDLQDVYAHMRRDGSTVHDSLWFFTGVSTYGTSGSRYFDIELYKNLFSYNGATGKFTSAGANAGHTQWLFDASGNLVQTGDLIVAVNYSPGSAPVVDVRIWVSQATWSSVTPAYFNFNANFDGATPSFGYASIVSKAGATAFGAGIANYSATAAQDTTYATPWGTTGSSGWSTQYESLQFIEVGLNLTRIGIDPALYTALGSSACQSLFSNIFFKSRSSNSFVSNMQDFMIPLTFLRDPVMDYTLQPDTLRCNHTSGTIQITNNSTAGYYTWTTANGSISGSSTDSSQLTINKPGTYIVTASPAPGCPATRKDTVVIPIDTFPPKASVNITMPNYSHLQLIGGDLAASNYATPFGGSQGLTWSWTGPKSFTSTIQNPQTPDTAWGTYNLTVTEKRNGCTAKASKAISVYDFVTLQANVLQLHGEYQDNGILLNWVAAAPTGISFYEVEKYNADGGFETILSLAGSNNNDPLLTGTFSAMDRHVNEGNNTYRIKVTALDGAVFYSGVISVPGHPGILKSVYLNNASPERTTLIINTDHNNMGILTIYSISGQLLWKSNINLVKGQNEFDIPVLNKVNKVINIVSLSINGRVSFVGKQGF